jgi:hypothetical protein
MFSFCCKIRDGNFIHFVVCFLIINLTINLMYKIYPESGWSGKTNLFFVYLCILKINV